MATYVLKSCMTGNGVNGLCHCIVVRRVYSPLPVWIQPYKGYTCVLSTILREGGVALVMQHVMVKLEVTL